MKKIKLTINGKEVLTESQKTILQVVEENHLDEIPSLCYDSRLPPYGACFLCVVEVEGRRGLVPSCSSMAEEGMVVHTSSKKIREARKTSLELMLSDHYADCFGPCKLTCPAGVDVQGYISLINLGKYREAIKLIKERNPLPLVCGRICVRECEIACRRGRVDAPVGIDYLKRYVADHDLSKMFVPERKPENGRRAAVIGGGPSGLTCAYYLALDGYPVTIFDSMPKLGGMLRYGIPEYRLPKEILDKEIDSIIGLGIEVKTDCKLGEDFHIPDLFKRGYEAVFVGLGAQQSTDMRIEGEKAEGIISGIGFLRDIELKGMSSLDGRVVVVGGGNTAIDAARTSLRVGADEVTLLYRRTIQEMPAHSAEIKAAEEEGVNFIFLSAPAKVITSNGRLSAVECVKMSLGEPDASGRRRPVPIKGSEYILHCNYVISAIGQAIDPSGLDKDAKIEITKKGRISVNPGIMETSYPGVFAGGDVVSGPATAIEAIDHGRKAAISIHNYLNQNQQKSVMYEFKSKKDIFGGPDEREFESIPNLPGEIMPEIPIAQRIHNFHEIETGLQEDQVKTESSRCLECGCNYVYDCLLKKYATQYGITDLLYKGDVNRYKIDDRHPFIVLDSNKCIQCGKCVRTCAEILDVSALGFVYRGFRTIVKPSMEKPLQATNCISCGNCISACPTGAITEKLPYKKQGPWVMKETPSICHYCSIGCNLNIKHKADDLFFVTTSNGKSLNNGYLCSKGRFGYYYHLNNTDRNTTPKIKREGRLVDVSWQEAIEFAGQRLMEIKKRYGPDSIALFASSELSNEELYLIQKLGRGVIGTNNIGSFANSLIPKDLNALDESLGITASTNPMIELKKADVIMLINSDPTEEHPVLGFTIKNLAKKNLTKLIVARSMEIDMVNHADIWLDSRKRTNTVLLNGIMGWIIQNTRQNRSFINENTTGFREFKEMLDKITLSEVSNISGVSMEKIQQCAEILSDPDLNLMIIYNIDSMTERSENDLRAIGNLLLLTGKIGKPSNGVILLREHCNSQGLMDMGISQKYLPGYIPVNDSAGIKRLETIWGSKPGYITTANNNEEILSKMADGAIKACLIFGENPLKDPGNRRYLQSCEFLMIQDLFLTESCREAHVVLPGSTILETSGTYTNFERRIQASSGIFVPKCGKENWQVLCQLAERFGHTWKYQSPEDIFREILKATDLLPETGFNEIKAKEIYWNLPDRSKDGDYFLFEKGFNFSDKKGKFQTHSSELDIPPYQIFPYCSVCEKMEIFKDRNL
ncbi:MAG: molybdopterin-dependent oxidoreductase [Nitrospinota bacterium]